MTGLRAALTLDLTGRYAVQARQARSGLELWAGDDHVELHVHDDAGSPTVAADRCSSGCGVRCGRQRADGRASRSGRLRTTCATTTPRP